MHYGRFAFSGNGGVTILVRENFRARFGTVIGTAVALSPGDAAGLRQLYGVPNCPADLDGDRGVDLDDWRLFIKLFIANNYRADVNQDGLVDLNDLFEFLDALSGRACFTPDPRPVTLPGFDPITDPF